MLKRLLAVIALLSPALAGCQSARPRAKLVVEAPPDLSRTTYKLEVTLCP